MPRCTLGRVLDLCSVERSENGLQKLKRAAHMIWKTVKAPFPEAKQWTPPEDLIPTSEADDMAPTLFAEPHWGRTKYSWVAG